MHCEENRQLIRLEVGNDLRPEERSRLKSHLNSCPDCQRYYAEMETVMSVLSRASEDDADASIAYTSCWSRLNTVINQRSLNARASRHFNGRVAALCVCSLLLAVGTIVQQLPKARVDSGNAVMPAQPVSIRFKSEEAWPYDSAFPQRQPEQFDQFVPRWAPQATGTSEPIMF